MARASKIFRVSFVPNLWGREGRPRPVPERAGGRARRSPGKGPPNASLRRPQPCGGQARPGNRSSSPRSSRGGGGSQGALRLGRGGGPGRGRPVPLLPPTLDPRDRLGDEFV